MSKIRSYNWYIISYFQEHLANRIASTYKVIYNILSTVNFVTLQERGNDIVKYKYLISRIMVNVHIINC